MSAEQDAGKSGKKLFALSGLGAIVLFGGGYFALSWLTQSDSDVQSAVNINSTMNGGGRHVTETPHYRELLQADNERGAAAAIRNNQTFIASLPQGLDVPDTSEKHQPPAREPEKNRQQPPDRPAPEERVAGEKRVERLQKLIARINAQQSAGNAPTTAAAMWNRPPAETAEQSGRQRFGLQNASRSRSVADQGIQLIPALTRVPAYIITAVDSDNPSSKVIASIPSGRWAGAVLYSPGVKLAGDGVEIHFNRMSWNGMNLKINAYAQREDNLMSSVATSVNNRWFKHIVLPSILGGLGGVGTLYKDANTQVIQGNYGSVTGRVGMPDGKAVTGVIAGGMAEKGSQILTRQAESEPYKQVTVSQHEVVSVLFVDPVMSNSIPSDATGTPSLQPDTRPVTLAEAEQQTRHRLEAAIERRRAEMQRRYDEPQEIPQ
ncbi:TPA: conjugal transfer protein TraO [Salmonella enterica subsp. enterica serovar Typhimurium]